MYWVLSDDIDVLAYVEEGHEVERVRRVDLFWMVC